MIVVVLAVALLGVLAVLVLPSIHVIGPTQVGLVTKRFGRKKLSEGNPIAFNGEAGYQAALLMPGWRWKFWVTHSVKKHLWVQVPAGEIGVVIAQIGAPLPIGAKSAEYKPAFDDYRDLKAFMDAGGQKGVQRPVLPPGSLIPIHPVGFLVVTKRRVYGEPIDEDILEHVGEDGGLTCGAFGLQAEQLNVVEIKPQRNREGDPIDVVGIVTTFEGKPLLSSDIASRLGGFQDIVELEQSEGNVTDADLIETILGSKNDQHNNYQDFQAFLDSGGRIGLQHDPLLYGQYTLNPFLVSVELVPMLVIEQGEVAVVKAYVGLATEDTSGAEFKYGSLVKPGHRGIWQEPLRTGKYPVNPRCYSAEVVPTSILTLNWAEASSEAHTLDRQLSQIDAKSREGFLFKIDLQVQIHVPDTEAPKVISMVGTMQSLVNEVLQAAVGNHFRDKLQSMPAVKFIETRQTVQQEANDHIKEHLAQYRVETKGVYIQDVILPSQLVEVLTQREIAHQEIETYKKQAEAQTERVNTEKQRGTADQQAELARSEVGVTVKGNDAKARKAEADGEAAYIRETGTAQGAEVEAIGLAKAKGYEAQVAALGPNSTAIVNALTALADGRVDFVPEVLVTGGNGGNGGSSDALLGVVLQKILGGNDGAQTKRDADEESVTPKRRASSKKELAPSPLQPS